MSSAVTAAVGGVTTTVGVLARHIPAVEAFLANVSGETPDRGADQLPITRETAEEYGFLLNHYTGTRALYGHPEGLSRLREHITELADQAPGVPIVLKNPWEMGSEARLLADFPDAQVIILRRRVADIERSVTRALLRTSASPYARALEWDEEGHARFQAQIHSPWRRALLLLAYRWALRRRVFRLARSVRELPLDRVAVLSYDELRADPVGGAAWAAHLMDPEALAEAFAARVFSEQAAPAPASLPQRALDRRWERAWAQVRRAQVRAGLLAAPSEAPNAARRLRPFRTVLAALLRAAPQLTPHLEKLLWRGFYEVASAGPRETGTTIMNYGYAPLDRAWDNPTAGEHEFGLRLYAAVAGAADLRGKDVLEVSCGRGGGTAFVFDQLGPRSVVGLDLATRAVARCRARYGRPGLTFVAGDAEALPFPDESFDAVLSVEATHCYSSVPRFLSEVRRVLRPGGLLLLTDFRHTVLPPGAEEALVPQEDVRRLRDQLTAAGFQTLDEEDITDNVVRALALATPSRRARIERRVPRPLRRQALAFAAVEGSAMYDAFQEHRWTYLRFVLQRG